MGLVLQDAGIYQNCAGSYVVSIFRYQHHFLSEMYPLRAQKIMSIVKELYLVSVNLADNALSSLKLASEVIEMIDLLEKKFGKARSIKAAAQEIPAFLKKLLLKNRSPQNARLIATVFSLTVED